MQIHLEKIRNLTAYKNKIMDQSLNFSYFPKVLVFIWKSMKTVKIYIYIFFCFGEKRKE